MLIYFHDILMEFDLLVQKKIKLEPIGFYTNEQKEDFHNDSFFFESIYTVIFQKTIVLVQSQQ